MKLDTNDEQKKRIIEQILSKLPEEGRTVYRAAIKEALDITEYGRAVHAEMDAILTCARFGVTPQGAILYTTTFPCHNCTRHIIAAGIQRVVYIEPYAKSRAEELHEDAIVVEEKLHEGIRSKTKKIPFSPFVGVGPRRFFDLFSLTLSSGHELHRIDSGKILEITRQGAWIRVPMSP